MYNEDPFDAIIYMRKLDGGDDSVEQYIDMLVDIGESNGVPVFSSEIPFDYELRHGKVLIVPFGGDGTMLAAMRKATAFEDGTVFGMNFGRLGFLTNSEHPDNFGPAIRSLIETRGSSTLGWKRDRRMVIRSYDGISGSVAVNEFLVTTPTRKHPLVYDVFINDSHVAEQRGDGIIVTTATGSTAYAMSAGGAVMAPTSRAMQIVPLAAHTLTSRPIVVSEDDTIRIVANTSERVREIQVFGDGNLVAEHVNDLEYCVTIKKHRFVSIWRSADWNFFDVLSEKMGWGK